MSKTEHFLFQWTLWVLTQIYSKTRVYWNYLSQSIWKFQQRQPIPTHYLLEMLRLIDPQRKFLPLQWKGLPTKPWNCEGYKDSRFDSFANIFMTYIETTTLSKTVFRTTVWKCYVHDIFALWDMSKPDIEAFIEQANFWIHGWNIWHWPCVFRHGCIQRHKIQGKIYPWCKDAFLAKANLLAHTFHLVSPSRC